jgi:membrane-anchored protein YejM (alkaline phosphatase superfamily)
MALDQDTDPTPMHNRYRNSVRYVDSLAGRVLDDLRSRGLLDDTIVVVTGDHGQEFNDLELNYWGHNSNFAPAQTHVPMIVHWPGREPRTFTHVTSHMDVAPTFMTEVLGCTNPADDYSVGRDLFDTSDRGVLSMAGYNVQAGVFPRRRYVVAAQSGDLDVLDASYRPSTMTDADRDVLKVMLRQRSWFRPRSSN